MLLTCIVQVFACQTYATETSSQRAPPKPPRSYSSSNNSSSSSSEYEAYANESDAQYVDALETVDESASQPELKQFCSKFPLTQVVPTLAEARADMVTALQVKYSASHPGGDVRVLSAHAHVHQSGEFVHFLRVEFDEPAQPNGGLIFHYNLNISFNGSMLMYKPVREAMLCEAMLMHIHAMHLH